MYIYIFIVFTFSNFSLSFLNSCSVCDFSCKAVFRVSSFLARLAINSSLSANRSLYWWFKRFDASCDYKKRKWVREKERMSVRGMKEDKEKEEWR